MQETILEVLKLNKTFKQADFPSLDGIDFSILRGEKFGIFGPNGAGKTTLISILCGLLEPTFGYVAYNLNNSKISPKETQSIIGYAPQDFAFYPELSAQHNLMYFGGLYGIDKNSLEEKISYLLHRVGLNHVAKKKVSTYSGGMKRRLNLIIALLNDPKIIFLDEPTVGVDIQSKHAIFEFLNELNTNGTTIIYTSHHLKEAEEFCNRMALLDSGKLIAINSMDQLLHQNNAESLEELILKLTGNVLRD
jgi:ABC-2 type transport system ATP-binding protein